MNKELTKKDMWIVFLILISVLCEIIGLAWFDII